MSTSTVDTDVRSYLDSVAAHLQDIPEGERRELLDDLHQHLLEVAAEGEGTLEERLGSPEAYARELRSSADLSPPHEDGGPLRRALVRIERSGAIRAVAALRRTTAGRWGSAATEDLRPGWWALRGYAMVSMGAILANHGYNPYFSSRAGLLDIVAPEAFGSRVTGIVAGLAAAWASLEIGRRGRTIATLRGVSILLSIAAVALGYNAMSVTRNVTLYTDDQVVTAHSLQQPDGSAITNICPYAPDGTPIESVLLFDQNGTPIEADTPRFGEEPVAVPSPFVPDQAPGNAYPRPMRVIDRDTRAEAEFRCPDVRSTPAPGEGD